jgi:hypothetical protein
MGSRFQAEMWGWKELVAAHKQMQNAMRPSDAYGRLFHRIAMDARDAAEARTHVDTGALSMSHRVDFSNTGFRGGPEATVYVSPIRNPKTGILTVDYAEEEASRGGDHDFYDLVIRKDLEKIVYTALVDEWEGRFFR